MFALLRAPRLGINCVPRFKQIFAAEIHALARSAPLAAASSGQQIPPVALVQGASRGLGLEYAQQLLKRDGQKYVLFCGMSHGIAASMRGELQDVQPNGVNLMQSHCNMSVSRKLHQPEGSAKPA